MSKYATNDNNFQQFLPLISKILLAGVVIGLAVWGLSWWLNSGEEPTREEPAFTVPIQATYNDTKGNPEADLALVFLSDYQCPACRANEINMESIVNDYQDDVLFIYKHLPLDDIHPFARSAAEAVQAAGRQDKYFEYSELAFNLQDTGYSNQAYQDLAERLGLDVDKFNQDRRSKEVRDEVEFDTQDVIDTDLSSCSVGKPAGSRANLGTPMGILYLDDKVVDCWSGGLTPEDFAAKVDPYLEDQSSTEDSE